MRSYIRSVSAAKLSRETYYALNRLNFRDCSAMRVILRKARKENRSNPIWIAWTPDGAGQKIIGWAICKDFHQRWGLSTCVWVHGRYRRLGIGSKLLSKVAQYSEENQQPIRVYPHSPGTRLFFQQTIDYA